MDGIFLNFAIPKSDNVMNLIDIRKYEVVKKLTDEQYTNSSNTNKACLSPDSKFSLVGGKGKVFVFNCETGEVFFKLRIIHKID